ncbi:DNA helicase RecQ [Marinobacterium sp. AK62]|uniref:DNA helicase RecQ n=1 Tax=Marinobacterium alkalitolerans TaxID=1542925 RepID=A0ABS3ZEJ0_9GAMM|nr:DNA helicase RecQ [Marinobacterium alkalitolerans]MBP0050122.1 DNA helicase RecQ [Marinobacterium alkalitolerans]
MIERAQHILAEVFGFESFRPPQDEVVKTLIQGQDALVVMPTGGGKSLCYQLPALVRDGCGIVVSPLIALMQDQVSALSQLGIRAGCLNSSMSLDALQATEQQLRTGELDLLYVAPERLQTPRTQQLLSQCRLALFAIDEAHCVSQWGHDFRPEYMQLNQLRHLFPGVPRIALTATADARTRQEIVDRLELTDAQRFVCGFDRPNIRYRIGQKDRAREQLLRFIREEHPQDVGVVYCLSRKRVEETAAWLCERGFNALPYHAGLEAGLRQHHQHRFLTEEPVIMVATIAFGMGIDKPNVRFVAHLDLPRSIEAYYQETGRAGRDGLPADAWMVYGLQDVIFLRQMLEGSTAEDAQKQIERQKLEAMLGLCEITSCRRQALLEYFGEDDHAPCGNCDTCLEPVPVWDGTEPARKALSAVYRSGQQYGVNYVIDILRGQSNEKTRQRGHERLSTWGIGKELDAREWRSIFRQLVARGYLNVDPQGFGVLHLSERCRPLLRGEESLELRRDLRAAAAGGKSRSGASSARQQRLDADEKQLWEALRGLRKQIATEQDVPPYVIFHDATLMEMVLYRPLQPEQLRRLSGVGERKLALYGEPFMELIAEHNAQADSAQSDQAEQSLMLYRSGMTVEQVARQQKLSPNVIYGHLAQAIRSGMISVDEVVELPASERSEIETTIRFCHQQFGDSLKSVHEALEGRYDYGLLRCIRQGMAL